MLKQKKKIIQYAINDFLTNTLGVNRLFKSWYELFKFEISWKSVKTYPYQNIHRMQN